MKTRSVTCLVEEKTIQIHYSLYCIKDPNFRSSNLAMLLEVCPSRNRGLSFLLTVYLGFQIPMIIGASRS